MPLFEYACRSCDRRFEYLTRADQAPSCPSCGSADLEKQLSTFAVNTPAARTAMSSGPGACGMCGDPRGPGACSIN